MHIDFISFSLKEQQNAKKKVYFNDNGFVSLSFKFSSNQGKLLENLVLTELIKAGYENYFYNKNFECDFIARKEGRTIAIQVCYELNEKIIITYNQAERVEGIKVVSFWEFFS